MRPDLKGHTPETWVCVDCGVNTAPGCSNRRQLEQAFAAINIRAKPGVDQIIDENSEVYYVREKTWAAAGIGPMDGCLCIGCLEKRIKRRLKPKDFPRSHPFNTMPGTERLLSRRDGVVAR